MAEQQENPTIARMRDELSCAVCQEVFNEPKTLPCLHTFCFQCLVGSEASRRRTRGRNDPPDKVECPMCLTVSEIRGGIEGITTNFVYVKLVEHLKVHERLTSGNLLECGKCVKEPGEPPSHSVSYCYDCRAPLCQFCQKMHKQTVDLKGHHVCSLEEIRHVDLSPPPASANSRQDDVLYVCPKHQEPRKLYCFTCEEVICRDCTVTKKDHREHSYDFISEIIKEEREALARCLEPLREMKEKVVACSDWIKAYEKDLVGRQERRKERIDQVIDKGIEILRSRREQLQETARNVCTVKRKNLDIQMEGVEVVRGSVESAIDFTHTTVEKGSDVEVMLYKKEILARSETLRDMIRKSFDTFEISETDAVQFVHDLRPVEDFGRLVEAPSAAKSTAEGEGLRGPMQDEETTFTVQARNDKECPLPHSGGCVCSAHISITPAPTGKPETVPSTVTDNKDGTYTVSYRPRFPGVNKISVKFDEEEISGSPFDVNVVRNYSRPIGVPHTFPIPNASPWGLAMISDTEMVVSASDYIVHVYDIHGEEISRVHSNFTRPYGVSTDHRGHLWVTDREAHMVQKFYRNDSGEFVKLFQFGSRGINAGQFSHPRGIAVHPDTDDIYISDMKNNRIQIFKAESPVPSYKDQFGAPGKTQGLFNLPAGLCFNRKQQLVVCDDHNCRLQVFDAEGKFVEMLGTTRAQKGLLCSPIGIAMDFHGRYVITEFGSHCVTFLSPEGDILNCVRSVGPGYGQFVHPRGIALDSSGYVYIADNENMRIARF